MHEDGDERERRPLLAEPVDESEMLVETRDLVSASRSCLAIILLLTLIVLIACVFLVAQFFR
ncbi:MAG: hypothetical protein WBA63_12430 [Thermomicrobiales bacterium]